MCRNKAFVNERGGVLKMYAAQASEQVTQLMCVLQQFLNLRMDR